MNAQPHCGNCGREYPPCEVCGRPNTWFAPYHSMECAKVWREETDRCYVVATSSRTCPFGTKSCVADHAPRTTSPKSEP